MACSFCNDKSAIHSLDEHIRHFYDGCQLWYCPVCGGNVASEQWLEELKQKLMDMVAEKPEIIEPYVPKTPTPEQYLANIDISKEMQLLQGVNMFGSYEAYKTAKVRTFEMFNEVFKKGENNNG